MENTDCFYCLNCQAITVFQNYDGSCSCTKCGGIKTNIYYEN